MKTYQEVMAECENEDRMQWDHEVATYFCRKLFRHRGYGVRIQDRLEETLQGAFLRWISLEGKRSPACCILAEDRKLTKREILYGEVFTHCQMDTLKQDPIEASASDIVRGDFSFFCTLDDLLNSIPDRASQRLFTLLAKGKSKKDIAEILGISRPTLYARIGKLEEHFDKLFDIAEDVLPMSTIIYGEECKADAMTEILKAMGHGPSMVHAPYTPTSEVIGDASDALLALCESLTA